MASDQQGNQQHFFYRKRLAHFNIHYFGPRLWNEPVHYKTVLTI